MQKRYPLAKYIKAVEKLVAQKKGLRVRVYQGKGSAIGFEVFMGEEKEPWDVWTVHTSHTKQKEIWSKEDYRKPDRCLGTNSGEFMAILENL